MEGTRPVGMRLDEASLAETLEARTASQEGPIDWADLKAELDLGE
jgi:hypothetical protein